MLPHGARKDRCKDPNGTAKGDRQGEHGHPFWTKNAEFHCRSIVTQIPING